jgi:hypothetical protein
VRLGRPFQREGLPDDRADPARRRLGQGRRGQPPEFGGLVLPDPVDGDLAGAGLLAVDRGEPPSDMPWAENRPPSAVTPKAAAPRRPPAPSNTTSAPWPPVISRTRSAQPGWE